MERPRLRPIRNRLLAVEVAGMALFSWSAWAGGAVGLGTEAITRQKVSPAVADRSETYSYISATRASRVCVKST